MLYLPISFRGAGPRQFSLLSSFVVTQYLLPLYSVPSEKFSMYEKLTVQQYICMNKTMYSSVNISMTHMHIVQFQFQLTFIWHKSHMNRIISNSFSEMKPTSQQLAVTILFTLVLPKARDPATWELPPLWSCFTTTTLLWGCKQFNTDQILMTKHMHTYKCTVISAPTQTFHRITWMRT